MPSLRSPAIRRVRQRHVQGIGRGERAQPIRPLDHDDVGPRLIPPEFLECAWSVQTPQIEMMHRAAPGLVTLHEREGRARHVEMRIIGRRAEQRAGEGAFAGAERPLKQYRIAGPHRGRDGGGKRVRRREVGQHEGRDRACKHEANVPTGAQRGKGVAAACQAAQRG